MVALSQLPKVAYAAVGIGILIALYKVYRIFVPSTEAEVAKQELKMEKDIEKVLGRVKGYTNLTSGEHKQRAQALHQAMKGWGTDEDSIFNQLEAGNPTPDDILLIYSAFGAKYYDSDAGSQKLDYWLRAEMDEDDLARVRVKFAGTKITI